MGSGDHDTLYAWGSPLVHLKPWEQAHLLLMRGLVMDYRAGVRGGAPDGDMDYAVPLLVGLLLVDDSRP